jgi:hypothetical protein
VRKTLLKIRNYLIRTLIIKNSGPISINIIIKRLKLLLDQRGVKKKLYKVK